MSAQFTRVPREELERMAREEYARQFPRGRPAPAQPRNVRATLLSMGEGRLEITHRGRSYELLPVTFSDGLRLQEARAAIERADHAQHNTDELTPEVMRDYYMALKHVVSLAPQYLRPVGRVRRLLWRLGLTRNPYRGATEAEVGQLLGFFLATSTRSSVRFRAN